MGACKLHKIITNLHIIIANFLKFVKFVINFFASDTFCPLRRESTCYINRVNTNCGDKMNHFKKNTLVKDKHTHQIFIITDSYYKRIRHGNSFDKLLMYKCIEPHLPRITQIRQEHELTEIK